MKIREQKLRDAFNSIKRDMEEIRQVQRSQSEAFNLKLNTRTGDLSQRLDIILSEIRTSLADAVDKTGRDVERISQAAKESLDAGSEVPKLRKDMALVKSEVDVLKNTLDDTDRKLELLSNKLQEFENLSVDVDDVENDFVSRKAFEEHMDFIYPLVGVDKRVKKLKKQNERIDARLQDIENERYAYAAKEQAERLQEELIELRTNLAMKDEISAMNSRIDSMEAAMQKRFDRSGDEVKKIQNDMVDIYKLKKSFVSVEQFRDMRKEIRLLVQGLKDVQKLKEKMAKVRLSAKKAAAKKVPAKKPTAAPDVRKASVKKVVSKKASKKKVKAKKAASKRPTAKKARAKKPAEKKATAKRPAARKTVSKKKISAKKIAPKSAQKEDATRKAAGKIIGSVVDFFTEEEIKK